MKMKNIGIILSLFALMLLTACGDGQVGTKAETETVEAVASSETTKEIEVAETTEETEAVDQTSSSEESPISAEFNEELNRFVDGVTEYSNKDKYHRDRYKSLAPTANKEGTLKKYKEFLDDYDIYLESYYLTPKNDVEGELTKHMRNYIMHMKSRNSYRKKFTETRDSMYDKLVAEEANEAVIALESLVNAMIKHEIIKE